MYPAGGVVGDLGGYAWCRSIGKEELLVLSA